MSGLGKIVSLVLPPPFLLLLLTVISEFLATQNK